MRFRITEILLTLLVLAGAGWMTRPLSDRAMDSGLASAELEAMTASVGQIGQGVSFAILGGYRSLVANMVWLSMNADWEERDFATTNAKIRLTTSVDPRPVDFWINGARVIANDMPVWAVGDWNAQQLVETEEGRALRRRFAGLALDFLKKAQQAHPNRPEVLIEQAIIHWRKLEDLETAAELFGVASQMEDAPFYASRIYAGLLERLDRPEAALEYLESIVDDLPPNDPRAMKPVVEARIQRLRSVVNARN